MTAVNVPLFSPSISLFLCGMPLCQLMNCGMKTQRVSAVYSLCSAWSFRQKPPRKHEDLWRIKLINFLKLKIPNDCHKHPPWRIIGIVLVWSLRSQKTPTKF
jgi:hypothetical protein